MSLTSSVSSRTISDLSQPVKDRLETEFGRRIFLVSDVCVCRLRHTHQLRHLSPYSTLSLRPASQTLRVPTASDLDPTRYFVSIRVGSGRCVTSLVMSSINRRSRRPETNKRQEEVDRAKETFMFVYNRVFCVVPHSSMLSFVTTGVGQWTVDLFDVCGRHPN